MSELLSSETAVVTGGASGIGRAIARRFADHGANVVVADLRPEPRLDGQPTHELIEAETDSEAYYIECNVANIGDLDAAVEAAESMGGIDIMVNNAGIFREEDFFEVTEEEFDGLFDVNVKGVYFGAQRAAERMRAQGGGSIINMSSVAGYRGAANYEAYCASKGAVRLFTYALADRLGEYDIRVNAIHPGTIETAMSTEDVELFGTDRETELLESVPLGERGLPTDVADTAVYLASDLSAYVTGESIIVDGGRTNT